MCREVAEGEPFGIGIALIVQKDATASDAAFAPVLDADTLVGCIDDF